MDQKIKDMETRLKSSLAADFEAKYGCLLEKIGVDINGLKGENSWLKGEMDGLKGEHSWLKGEMDGLKEFCSSIAETTIINVAGEIILFCIHEQPMKQPKKLKADAKNNVEKMKQKFGDEFIQDSQTIIDCRKNSRVHYSRLEQLRLEVNQCIIAFKAFPQLCIKYSLQKKYIDSFDWIVGNLSFKP